MTVQEMDGQVALTLGLMSRLTVKGTQHLAAVHMHTMGLLRWHKRGFIRILPKTFPALESLNRAIYTVANDRELYAPEKTQQTFEWEELLP